MLGLVSEYCTFVTVYTPAMTFTKEPKTMPTTISKVRCNLAITGFIC